MELRTESSVQLQSFGGLSSHDDGHVNRDVADDVEAVRAAELVETLALGARRRVRAPWVSLAIFVPYLFLAWLVETWFLFHYPHATGLWQNLVSSLTGGGAFAYMASLWCASARLSRKEREAARQLRSYTDPRSIGPLLEAAGIADTKTREIIIESLIASLTRLTPTDSAVLRDRTVRGIYSLARDPGGVLYRRWAGERAADIAVAALHAIGQIGDSRALEQVRRLAFEEPEIDESIRAAAQSCLPLLNRRIALEERRTTLVMPATGPPEALLIPTSAGISRPDDLVRPVSEDRLTD